MLYIFLVNGGDLKVRHQIPFLLYRTQLHRMVWVARRWNQRDSSTALPQEDSRWALDLSTRIHQNFLLTEHSCSQKMENFMPVPTRGWIWLRKDHWTGITLASKNHLLEPKFPPALVRTFVLMGKTLWIFEFTHKCPRAVLLLFWDIYRAVLYFPEGSVESKWSGMKLSKICCHCFESWIQQSCKLI